MSKLRWAEPLLSSRAWSVPLAPSCHGAGHRHCHLDFLFSLAILLPCRTIEVEWDEQKRHTNIAKHGLDFVAAAKVFDGPILEVEDRRRYYGEVRFLALGEVAGQVIHVVYTWRGRRRRIISARRASRDERQRYYASIQR
jgi:uncharacterized protein